MCRGTLYVFFLFTGFKTGKVKIVVGDTPPLVGVEAEAGEDVRFRLPTDQRNALPDAPIKAFLTRNIRPGEEEPAVLRLADCTEVRTVNHPDTVQVFLDDFQRTQLELSELMLRVGYYSPL